MTIGRNITEISVRVYSKENAVIFRIEKVLSQIFKTKRLLSIFSLFCVVVRIEHLVVLDKATVSCDVKTKY